VADAHIASPSPQRWTALLISAGAVFAIIGLIGALLAKHSADLASALSSEHARLFTPGGSSSTSANIALQFAPTAAPDYTLFWLALTVIIVGLIAALAGMAVALRGRRTS
jgi:predicted permease